MNPLVLVLLGTDHHPFDRLVAWADEVAELRPDLRFVVQHGTSGPPRVAEGRDYLPHRELLDLACAASAVACHGGPGTIMDARGAGHVPVCVPRDPAFGEHVDRHQVRFAAIASGAGLVRVVNRVDQFHAALHAAVSASGDRGVAVPLPRSPVVDDARERLIRELDRLVVAGPPHRMHHRRDS